MSISNNLEKKIINNGSDRFIQLTLQNEKIQDFEIGFLNSVDEDGLIGVEKTIFDNIVNLKYCITGLITIEQYFKNIENTKENMVKIFTSISEVISKSSFLTSNKFIVESDMIFINPESLKVNLIYLPTISEYTTNISKDFKVMVADVISKILDEGNIKEGSADFVIAINKKTQEDEVTIADFIEYAKKQSEIKVLNTQINNQNARQMANTNNNSATAFGQSYSKPVQQNVLKEKPVSTMNPDKVQNSYINANSINPKETETMSAQNTRSNTKRNRGKNIQPEEPEVKEILRYKTSRILTTIVLQPIFIGLVLALFLIDGVGVVQVMGGGLLILALDGIIVKSLLDPSKKEKVKVTVAQKSNKKYEKGKNAEGNKTDTGSNIKSNNKNTVVENKIVERQPIVFEEETTMIDTPQVFEEETTLISTQPYLEINNGSRAGREEITSDNYIIGRNAGLRTWISGSGVSREHAAIINMGSNYIIRDLNSKNGTKVNGIKLVGNQDVPLNDGDVIEIPSLTITFII